MEKSLSRKATISVWVDTWWHAAAALAIYEIGTSIADTETKDTADWIFSLLAKSVLLAAFGYLMRRKGHNEWWPSQ